MTDASHKINIRKERGFTLLEVIAAFLILSLTIAGVMQVFSGGMRGTVASNGYLGLLAHAESELARIGRDVPLRPGAASGTFADGTHWRRVIRPYEAEGVAPAAGLYRVEVTISASDRGDARDVTLTTLKLAAVP